MTTSPDFAPRRTGDVVISVPLRKFLEFRTIPVIEPSEFCLNLLTIGMLSETEVCFLDAVALGAEPPPKENPNVDFATDFGFSDSGAGTAAGFFAGLAPPKILKVGLF